MSRQRQSIKKTLPFEEYIKANYKPSIYNLLKDSIPDLIAVAKAVGAKISPCDIYIVLSMRLLQKVYSNENAQQSSVDSNIYGGGNKGKRTDADADSDSISRAKMSLAHDRSRLAKMTVLLDIKSYAKQTIPVNALQLQLQRHHPIFRQATLLPYHKKIDEKDAMQQLQNVMVKLISQIRKLAKQVPGVPYEVSFRQHGERRRLFSIYHYEHDDTVMITLDRVYEGSTMRFTFFPGFDFKSTDPIKNREKFEIENEMPSIGAKYYDTDFYTNSNSIGALDGMLEILHSELDHRKEVAEKYIVTAPSIYLQSLTFGSYVRRDHEVVPKDILKYQDTLLTILHSFMGGHVAPPSDHVPSCDATMPTIDRCIPVNTCMIALDITQGAAEKALYETVYADIKDQELIDGCVSFKFAELPPELDNVRACLKKVTSSRSGPSRGRIIPSIPTIPTIPTKNVSNSYKLCKTGQKVTKNNVTRSTYLLGEKECVKYNNQVLSIAEFESQTKKSRRKTK